MHIQKATAADLPKAMQCYEEIIDKTPDIEHLAMWRKGQHPTEETILSYINKGEFYILWDHETIAGMMALANGISETYRTVNWITKATDTEAAEHTDAAGGVRPHLIPLRTDQYDSQFGRVFFGKRQKSIAP